MVGEEGLEDIRDDVDGRKPFPRNGEVRPDVGLGAREWPVYSLIIANEAFLCWRGWFILRNNIYKLVIYLTNKVIF